VFSVAQQSELQQAASSAIGSIWMATGSGAQQTASQPHALFVTWRAAMAYRSRTFSRIS
jgi:hypothetical protein